MAADAPIVAALRLIGVSPSPPLLESLHRYGRWLEEEAAPAGGIGPQEVGRIARRHLADSLVFAWGWQEEGLSPDRVLDLGSGVGLPGIPLAIAFPAIDFTLVERSGRRVQLARRALRILDLDNVEISQEDMETTAATAPAAVSRASLPPHRLRHVLERVLEPGGVAVVGGSASAEEVPGFRFLHPPAEILDRGRPLLIMARP